MKLNTTILRSPEGTQGGKPQDPAAIKNIQDKLVDHSKQLEESASQLTDAAKAELEKLRLELERKNAEVEHLEAKHKAVKDQLSNANTQLGYTVEEKRLLKAGIEKRQQEIEGAKAEMVAAQRSATAAETERKNVIAELAKAQEENARLKATAPAAPPPLPPTPSTAPAPTAPAAPTTPTPSPAAAPTTAAPKSKIDQKVMNQIIIGLFAIVIVILIIMMLPGMRNLFNRVETAAVNAAEQRPVVAAPEPKRPVVEEPVRRPQDLNWKMDVKIGDNNTINAPLVVMNYGKMGSVQKIPSGNGNDLEETTVKTVQPGAPLTVEIDPSWYVRYEVLSGPNPDIELDYGNGLEHRYLERGRWVKAIRFGVPAGSPASTDVRFTARKF